MHLIRLRRQKQATLRRLARPSKLLMLIHAIGMWNRDRVNLVVLRVQGTAVPDSRGLVNVPKGRAI